MSLTETTAQLESVLNAITKDLRKVSKGNQAAAQRIRVGTLLLEKVGKVFRKESVAAAKFAKSKTKRLFKRSIKKTKKRKR